MLPAGLRSAYKQSRCPLRELTPGPTLKSACYHLFQSLWKISCRPPLPISSRPNLEGWKSQRLHPWPSSQAIVLTGERRQAVIHSSYRDACPTAPPIASPDTTSSTRRFCWRPTAVLLSVTGRVLPKPTDVIASADTPCETR